jgi:hypothetical protein
MQVEKHWFQLKMCVSAGYNSSMAIAEAKQRSADSMKRYKQLKKNPRPKLYDKPPHLIKQSE